MLMNGKIGTGRFRALDLGKFIALDSRRMEMTKSAVRSALGFTKDRQLAEFFGVGKGAVSNWGEDDLLPEVRQWQAKALRPDLFGDATGQAA
jgi:hypothetical protein